MSSSDRSIVMALPVTLTALVHPEDDGGYSAEVPALPGCHTEGETLEDVQANLVDAAEGWLAARHELILEERLRSEAQTASAARQ
jgi:predicted RNase H-like HicB family nuclease